MRFVRRCLMTLGALSLVPLLLAAVTWLRSGPDLPERSVLHLVLDGAIAEAPPASVTALWRDDPALHLAAMVDRLRAAADDSRVVGLLLEVKEPKVGLAQLAELQRAVADFRKSGKWTASYLETAGESGHGDGAFALASLTKDVILSPPGEIHLAGMHAEVPFLAETFARAHLDVHVQQRYEYKNFADTFTQRGFTEPHKEALKSLMDDMQQTLLQVLADNRHVAPGDVATWVQDAPFHAQAAKSRGLVDKVLYWDEVQDLVERVAGREDALVALADYAPKARKGATTPVAFVVGAGEINRGESGGGLNPDEGMGAETYVQALQQARQDKVRGVLLRLDSPGGSYLASDLIRREIVRTRAEKIPVVVSMGNTAASGGYFIAAEADHILAEAGTVTGSIGVVGASFAVGRALDHFFGVKFDRYDSLPHPGTLDMLTPPSPQQATRLGQQIDRVYNDFVSKVAAGRHKPFDEVHAMAKGRVWTGRQAVALGLADDVGGLDAAKAYLARRLEVAPEALDLQLYPAPKTTLELVRETLDVGVRSARAAQAVGLLGAPLRAQLTRALGGLNAASPGVQAQLDAAAAARP